MKRIIIAGGRDFSDTTKVMQALDQITPGLLAEEIQIISGGARGADTIGKDIAHKFNTNLAIFPAQWKRPDGSTDKSAGYRRNCLMAENADVLLAFWNGESKGTKHMIDIAKTKKLETFIIGY